MNRLLLLLAIVPYSLFAFQEDYTQTVKQNLNTYYRDQLPLKVHISMNQDGYLPGDTIFFKATVVTARDLRPLKINTILRVILKHRDGSIVADQMVRVAAGEGANQLVLSPSLASGSYLLVAYNDWMKNFNESLYFQKNIPVGRASQAVSDASSVPEFFPEGGTLVGGLNQKLVVKGATNARGVVKNRAGNDVVNFSTDESGLGSFFMTPVAGEQYGAVIGSKTFPLPEVKDDGFTILVTEQPQGTALRAVIQLPENSVYRKKKVYFIAAIHGKVFYAGNFQMEGKPFIALELPINDLPAGIASLSLAAEEKVLAERLFAVRETYPVSPAIALQASEFATRQKAEASIRLVDEHGQPMAGRMSVSVSNTDLVPYDSSDKTIVNNLYYYGDLAGTSTAPLNFFGSKASARVFDHYLVTQRWTHPLLGQAPGMQKRYFTSSIHLIGKAVSTAGRDVPDSARITFFLQKNISTYQAYIKDGKFDAALLMDFYGSDEAFYRVEYKGEKLEDVRLVVDQVEEAEKRTDIRAENRSAFFANRIAINESFQYYGSSAVSIKPPEPNSLFEEEIFGPDVEIKLNDYILFPTMEETLREVVPFVQHRKIRNKSVVRIFVDELDKFAEGSPLYVFDGVMTDDTEFFLRMKPSDISTIKVIYSLDKTRMFGDLGKGGIILIETKIPDFAATMPKAETTFKLRGLSEPLSFRNVGAQVTSNARIPDLRSALYWSPEIEPDENGNATVSFFTSDIPGNYVIKVEGITTAGKPFYSEQPFKVKFKPSSK